VNFRQEVRSAFGTKASTQQYISHLYWAEIFGEVLSQDLPNALGQTSIANHQFKQFEDIRLNLGLGRPSINRLQNGDALANGGNPAFNLGLLAKEYFEFGFGVKQRIRIRHIYKDCTI
jgi:hypothetical protein